MLKSIYKNSEKGRAGRGVRPCGEAGTGGVEPRPYGGVTRSAVNGPSGTPAPTEGYKRRGRTGRRGNRRSAASGGRSELISRKCPDWRVRQWPSVGWHDGGQPPPPTGGLQVGRRSGRPQGSPLRDVTWGAVERDFCLYIYNGERGRFWTVQGEIFYFCRV